MSCWAIVTSPGHWGELTRSLWTLETLRLPPPALSSPLETSGTWGSPGALPHLPLAIAPVSVRCRRRTFPAEGWSVSASSRCCFPTESWVSWAFHQACPPSPCRGGAGAGGPPCGSRSPGGPRPAALPDGGAPPPHAGVWAAAGSAAEPAARVSKRESTIKRWNGGLKTKKKKTWKKLKESSRFAFMCYWVSVCSSPPKRVLSYSAVISHKQVVFGTCLHLICWLLLDKTFLRHHQDRAAQQNTTKQTTTNRHKKGLHEYKKWRITPQRAISSAPHVGRRSFKLWSNYTLKASLRRYSSLAISSATQPGISGMATWMMYFSRIAKCCKTTETTEGQAQHTVTSRRQSQYVYYSALRKAKISLRQTEQTHF